MRDVVVAQIIEDRLSLLPYSLNSPNYIYRETSSSRSGHRRCSVRKGVPKNFAKSTRKHMCQSVFFNKFADLRPAISCEFCKISKNTFFTEHLWVTASVAVSIGYHNHLPNCICLFLIRKLEDTISTNIGLTLCPVHLRKLY